MKTSRRSCVAFENEAPRIVLPMAKEPIIRPPAPIPAAEHPPPPEVKVGDRVPMTRGQSVMLRTLEGAVIITHVGKDKNSSGDEPIVIEVRETGALLRKLVHDLH